MVKIEAPVEIILPANEGAITGQITEGSIPEQTTAEFEVVEGVAGHLENLLIQD